MSGIIEIIITVGTVAAIIVGVLGILFGFGFIGDALGEVFPEMEGSGAPFFFAGWLVVAIVIILLIIVIIKFVLD